MNGRQKLQNIGQNDEDICSKLDIKARQNVNWHTKRDHSSCIH